jgi:hypothetical protein
MKSSHRLGLGLGLVVATLLASGCKSASGDPNSHWNVDSVDQRVVKAFTGYRGAIDGSYLDYQYEQKQKAHLTLRRHFLNSNPYNPFQPDDPSLTQPRRPFGPLPDPFSWFGAETVVWGLVALGWSGSFVPAPVDSLLVLATPEGRSEFWRSMKGDWDPDFPRPPRPSTFRVKNR